MYRDFLQLQSFAWIQERIAKVGRAKVLQIIITERIIGKEKKSYEKSNYNNNRPRTLSWVRKKVAN